MIRARAERWPIRGAFAISRGAKTEAEVVVVEVERAGLVGRGECVPYRRYGESVDGVLALLASRHWPEDRHELLAVMPAGAARNALDCALWDLEAKQAGRRAYELAGLPAPAPLLTCFTISLGAPDEMAAAARAASAYPLLKLKLGGDRDEERVAAVRAARPKARLVADANEGWSAAELRRLLPLLAAHGVEVVEQPLPAAADEALAAGPWPVSLCADESFHSLADVGRLRARYGAVNVKLDKTGGLTAALGVVQAARAAGLQIMLGCMVGTSLGMAPAALLGSFAAWVDLDGPLLLARDREPGLRFDGAMLHPPGPALWG